MKIKARIENRVFVCKWIFFPEQNAYPQTVEHIGRNSIKKFYGFLRSHNANIF